MEEGKAASVASRALAKAALAQGEALSFARAGLDGGQPDLLAKAAALGWNPSMAGDWFARAMGEQSGASIEWLMERFPIDAALSPALRDPANDRSQAGCARWSAKAMLAVEEFALERAPLPQWIAACSKSPEGGEYFEATLAANPLWNQAMRGERRGLASSAALAALCIPVLAGSNARAAKACVDFCAAQLEELLPTVSKEESKLMLRGVFAVALSLLSARRPLGLIEPMLERLPRWMLGMGHMPLSRPARDPQSQRRRLEMVASELSSPKTARVSANEADPCWEIGAFALMGGVALDVDLALAQGWIGPIDVCVPQKFEDPDFIAYDSARTITCLGRPINTVERWLKCEQTIRSARIPEDWRESLLGRLELRDPSAWTEGSPKVHQVDRLKSSSPLALLLACWVDSDKDSNALESTVNKLLAAGFRLKDAVGVQDPLGAEASSKIKRLAWAQCVIEREEIEECSLAAPAKVKRMSL